MAITVRTLQQCKEQGTRFSVLTAYDATFAHQISAAGVDVILVGDSLGNVIQGRDSTVPVSIDDMAYHTRCVARGNQGSLVIADLPFMSAATLERCLDAAQRLMQAGANVVKLEGAGWLADTIAVLKRNGVPVCAHLGLTPQFVNAFGGYRVQGRDEAGARQLLADAVHLQNVGADMLLLECVPRTVTAELVRTVSIPVIGIGAGPDCDGQVLVMQDMLGITAGRPARFVRNFLTDGRSIQEAFRAYDQAVKDGSFPADEHCF